jgi:hypothetical protein
MGLQKFTLGKLEWHQENTQRARAALREARQILEGESKTCIALV